MSSKKASVRFNFPATKAIFINVIKPDTEYDAEGCYQISLVYDLQQAKKLKAQIEALDPSFDSLCKFRENEDGTATFKVKQKRFVRWVDRKTGDRQEIEMKPVVINADNTAYTGSEPWGGSVVEVGAVVETQAGANRKGIILALRLRGVRIHELVEGSAAGTDDPLFGGPVNTVMEETNDDPFTAYEDDVDDENAPI